MPEIAWVGCACDVIAWNAVRVTRASLDKQPHDVAAMFDQVADRYDLTNDVSGIGFRHDIVERDVDVDLGRLVTVEPQEVAEAVAAVEVGQPEEVVLQHQEVAWVSVMGH